MPTPFHRKTLEGRPRLLLPLFLLAVLMSGLGAVPGAAVFGSTRFDVGEEGPVCIGPDCVGGSAAPGEPIQDLLQETFDLSEDRFSPLRESEDAPNGENGSAMRKPPSVLVSSLEVGLESTDNVPSVSDELAAQVGDRGDHARIATLQLRTPSTSSRNRPQLEFGCTRTDYGRLQSFDSTTFRLAGTWRRRSSHRQWRFRPWVSRMDLGHRPYLQGWGAEVACRFSPRSRRSLEVRLQSRSSDYLRTPGSPFENRDGREWRLGLYEHVRFPLAGGRRAALSVGIDQARRQTAGADYDASSLGLSGFGLFEPHPKVLLLVNASIQRQDHQHPNHRDAQGRRRKDTSRTLSVRAEYRLSVTTRLFAGVLDRRNDSNLETLFSYRSRSWQGGCAIEF